MIALYSLVIYVMNQNFGHIDNNVSTDIKEDLLLIKKNAFNKRYFAFKSSYKSQSNITSPFSSPKVIKYVSLTKSIINLGF